MRNQLLICFSSLLLLSCSGSEKEPEGVLPEKKMQAIVYDMMRADQFLANFVFNRDTSLDRQKESIQLYSRIFRSHAVTRDEFQKSMDYYSARPDLLKILMDSVSALSLRRPVTPVTPVVPPVETPVIPKDTIVKDVPAKKIKPFTGN